jgi:zinc protease
MNLERKLAPEFRAIDNINLIRPAHQQLGNGCDIFCFDSGEQKVVRMEWIFNNERFNPASPLLNMTANTMLAEGTATLTASQIAGKVEFYGAFLHADYGYDHSRLTLHCLNKHLPHILPVIKDMITNSTAPQEELDTFIRNHQQKLRVNLQKNDYVARRVFNKAIYGDSLYGFVADIETFNTLHRDDVLVHLKRLYQPSNCTIIMAGNIEPHILDLVIHSFGSDWTNTAEEPDTTQPEIISSDEHFYFVEKPDALQSAIRMGAPSISRTHPDFPALQVLNTVLGGYFGSRLMANIREDKGYTYGIGSGVSALKHGGALFIATEVGADVCKSAIGEIEKELRLLQTNLVPDGELSLVRNYMLGSLLGSLENIFSHADKFKSLYFAGLDYDFYDRYVDTVKTVSAERLKELANLYLNFDEFYKIIVGKY